MVARPGHPSTIFPQPSTAKKGEPNRGVMRGLTLLALATTILAGLAGCSGSHKSSAEHAVAGSDCSQVPGVMDAWQHCLAPSAFPGPLPSFEQHYVADRPSGEPTLAISRDGTVLYPSTDFDAPAGLPRVKLYASKTGDDWKDVTPCLQDVSVPAPTVGGGVCAGKISPITLDPMV